MTDDAELLRRYGRDRDEAAFAEVVRRRVDLVYAAAMRQTRGDDALARDAVQAVFTDLARKAERVAEHEVLVGWLHTATRFAVAKAIRAESRRRAREQEAGTMSAVLGEAEPPVDWARLQPVLDAVLGELKERERAAILLRFFEEKTLAEVGAALALTETAARSCVDRALEKMQVRLARRGVTSTTAALAAVLANQVAMAAPAGLAAVVAKTALTAGAAGGALGVGVFMGMTKTQAVICGALLAAGAGGLTWEQRAQVRLGAEAAGLRREVTEEAALRAENATLVRQAAEVQALREGGGAELARLGDEAARLQQRLATETAQTRRAAAGATGARPAVKVYDPRELEQLPSPTYRTPPMYPDAERMAGKEGKAVVEFVVNEAGEVIDAQTVEATSEAFGASAVAALRKWKFQPGRKSGVPVGTRLRQPITFALDDAPAAAPTFWF